MSLRSSNFVCALAGCRTPRGDVTVAAAPLLLQFGTVAVQVCVFAGVGTQLVVAGFRAVTTGAS